MCQNLLSPSEASEEENHPQTLGNVSNGDSVNFPITERSKQFLDSFLCSFKIKNLFLRSAHFIFRKIYFDEKMRLRPCLKNNFLK